MPAWSLSIRASSHGCGSGMTMRKAIRLSCRRSSTGSRMMRQNTGDGGGYGSQRRRQAISRICSQVQSGIGSSNPSRRAGLINRLRISSPSAEIETFKDGDLPRTVSIRGTLQTRVSNAREFQSYDFAIYRASCPREFRQPPTGSEPSDDIYDLTDSEVAQLARLGPKEISSQDARVPQ